MSFWPKWMVDIARIPDDGQDTQSTKTKGLVADQGPFPLRRRSQNPAPATFAISFTTLLGHRTLLPACPTYPRQLFNIGTIPSHFLLMSKRAWTVGPLSPPKGFTTNLFDDATARHFILTALGHRYYQAFSLCYHPAMRCDYFRLCYIFLNGGFYIDADEVYQQTDCHHLFHDNCLKVQPLCYDTTSDTMVHRDAFIAQRQSSPGWIFYVNNNPLVSPPRHPVLRFALERATRMLLSSVGRPEIQDTTGPGNLSASLVQHAVSSEIAGQNPSVTLLPDWEAISVSPWALSYRNDARNWRLL